jgi:hypothetical protein
MIHWPKGPICCPIFQATHLLGDFCDVLIAAFALRLVCSQVGPHKRQLCPANAQRDANTAFVEPDAAQPGGLVAAPQAVDGCTGSVWVGSLRDNAACRLLCKTQIGIDVQT